MKRILILTGRYFPKASPNTICIQNIIDALPKDAYETEIICFEDGLGEKEERVHKISRGIIQ